MENKDIRKNIDEMDKLMRMLKEDVRKTNLEFYGRGLKERRWRALYHIKFLARQKTPVQPEEGILVNGVYYSEEEIKKMIDEEIRE